MSITAKRRRSTVLFSKPIIELLHAFFGTAVTPKPHRAPPQPSISHDTVDVSLADRDLDNPDLSTQVALLQLLDRVPVKPQLFGDILRSVPSDSVGPRSRQSALGIQGIVGEKLQALPFHRATTSAMHAPDVEIEVDPGVAAGQIPYPPSLPIVPPYVKNSLTATSGAVCTLWHIKSLSVIGSVFRTKFGVHYTPPLHPTPA